MNISLSPNETIVINIIGKGSVTITNHDSEDTEQKIKHGNPDEVERYISQQGDDDVDIIVYAHHPSFMKRKHTDVDRPDSLRRPSAIYRDSLRICYRKGEDNE